MIYVCGITIICMQYHWTNINFNRQSKYFTFCILAYEYHFDFLNELSVDTFMTTLTKHIKVFKPSIKFFYNKKSFRWFQRKSEIILFISGLFSWYSKNLTWNLNGFRNVVLQKGTFVHSNTIHIHTQKSFGFLFERATKCVRIIIFHFFFL